MTNQYIVDSDQTLSDAELLRNVRNMLARITFNGQEYVTSDGRRVSLPDYNALVQSERDLQARVAAASGPAVNIAAFHTRG